MALRQCSSQHCSGADAELNEVCKAEGWPVNHPVITRDENGPCYCSCSCLAHGTPVQSGDRSFKAIEDYQIGDTILACGKSLQWKEAKVEFSQGTIGASRQKYTVLIVYTDTFLAVTSDHLFLLLDGNLKPAAKLTPNDQLVSPDGQPVKIDSIHIGDYTAGFHHVATAKEQPDFDTLDRHLLNTNGVVSGDYALQLFYRSCPEQIKASLSPNEADMEIVGSPEYVAKWGDSCLKSPTAISDHTRAFSRVNIAHLNVSDHLQPTFIPAEKTIVNIPAYAHSFISEEEARQKASEPKRGWNDPNSREWTEAVIQLHKNNYPDVVYHLDWADDTVNAFAWVENGVRQVALKGGLIRSVALELEGIALVLAHELAHHYGGSPSFPTGLSCEGQADYQGVRIIMRKVWFGEAYTNTTDAAIQQMANWFGVPNDPNPPSGSAGCNHPPGACRVATYHAAVNLSGKPTCAG